MPTPRKAYALWNSYASDTDVGFSNTWSAYTFDDSLQRDAWLAKRADMASRACTRAEASKYLYHPRGDSVSKEGGYLLNPVTDVDVLVQKGRA